MGLVELVVNPSCLPNSPLGFSIKSTNPQVVTLKTGPWQLYISKLELPEGISLVYNLYRDYTKAGSYISCCTFMVASHEDCSLVHYVSFRPRCCSRWNGGCVAVAVTPSTRVLIRARVLMHSESRISPLVIPVSQL